MSEKPNSQERRQSNIEVHIPQVSASNEETGTSATTVPTTTEESGPGQQYDEDVSNENAQEIVDFQEKINESDVTDNNLATLREDAPIQDTNEVNVISEVSEDQSPKNTPNHPAVEEEINKKQSEKIDQIRKSEDQLADDTPNQSTVKEEITATQSENIILTEKDKNQLARDTDQSPVENTINIEKPQNTDLTVKSVNQQEDGTDNQSSVKKEINVNQSENTDQTQKSEDQQVHDTDNQIPGQENDKVDQPSPNIVNQQPAEQLNPPGHKTDDGSPIVKDKDAKQPENTDNPLEEIQENETDKKISESTENDTKATRLDDTQGNTETLPESMTNASTKEQPATYQESKESIHNWDSPPKKTDISTEDKETVTTNKLLHHSQNNDQDENAPTKPSTPKSPKSRNLEAMQVALSTKKESGKGFVLSSQFEEKENDFEEETLLSRDEPDGDELNTLTEPTHKLSTTSVRFQTSNKDQDTAYITETPEREITPDGRESRGSRTYSPAYFDTGARRSPDGEIENEKNNQKKKKDPKRTKILKRLDLPKPPEKFVLKLQPPKQDHDPTNKAPLNPNIYYAEVPKYGGQVKTPFYMQVDIPDGALDGKVRLKFEKQEFDSMKLSLSDGDMLCSYIVDLNMEPSSYCLKHDATVRMRILDKCINKFEDTIILTARHFSWRRIPTKIESKTVNGEKHYYAVTESQSFGKFAVVNTKKIDRFLISTAGGVFKSTIVPEIQLTVDENQLTHLPVQMIEMLVKETRQEAVQRINKEFTTIKGVEGQLVAASSVIEISKDLVAQTRKMKHGMRFPDKLTLVLPVPILLPSKNTDGIPQKRSVVIMQKHTNVHYNTIDGHRHLSSAYSKNTAHLWKDVTKTSKLAAEAVSFNHGEVIPIKVSAPGKYMVLVFEESDVAPTNSIEMGFDLDDVTNAVIRSNQEFTANIMIHQKISQPSIIFIHMVTSDAIQPIHDTMRATNAWRQLYVSRQLLVHEWQPIKIEFKGDLQSTINQMTPQIRFYSRRWQGYQIELEATEEAFASDLQTFVGKISFVEETDQTIRKTKSTFSVDSDDNETLCTVEVKIDQPHAKPYKPTVVKKILPKATIYREYKMKWLKNMSEEEIERYKSAQGI